MRHGLHLISGLPRSGSTLLSAILAQNPRFHAMMTSPVGSLYLSMLSAVSRSNDTAVFIDEGQRRALLTGVFWNYYYKIGEEKIIFDTNRMWCSKMPSISTQFPEAKVICCVRSIPWIMDSFERLCQNNPTELSGIFGFDPGGTVYSRINRLATSEGLVGFALDALREAFYGDFADRLILVCYEALARAPRETLAEIYDFIGEPWFEHDFDHVQYDADAFDLPLGTPGLHRVRPKVASIERRTVLPPDLFARFDNDAFWIHPQLNPRQVRIIPPPS